MLKSLGLAGVILVAAPAMAQTASPEAIATATAIVEKTNPSTNATAQVEAQIKQMRSGNAVRAVLSQSDRLRMELAKNQPSVNASIARLGEAQANAMGPILRDMQKTSRQAMIAAYAANFSVPELQQINSFFQTPAGAKFLQRQPIISRAVSDSQQKYAPRIQAAEKAFGTQLQAEVPKMFPQLMKQQAPAK